MLTILGISGSLRKESFNAALLRTVAGVAQEGCKVTYASGLRRTCKGSSNLFVPGSRCGLTFVLHGSKCFQAIKVHSPTRDDSP
jgi:NADPH-dependent FMN reductase